MVHVNYLAVLVATVVVFVLGWLWYSPLLFFKPWMRARASAKTRHRVHTVLHPRLRHRHLPFRPRR
ncbi:MAG: hypothetical protein DMD63_14300 [Gemmatimonadetes bacterium]|nr:MAG: hypothetical protein DMD63_14300 [Gemmatimonadota bacterium]